TSGKPENMANTHSEKIPAKELAEMEMYAKTAVLRILENPKLLNLQKWAEFDEWLENKMLR
ncbi:MAG: hypothetical protein KY445_12600, partial [Armatimonadetes bacterium]|nr:hypothetical protein [Armatimonadota bacterium]